MRGILNGNLKLWHMVVVGVLFALITGGTVALSAGPAAFWPSGSVRLASAQNDNTISITGSNNPAVRVLHATLTVPSGKKADLQATFTTDLHHNGPGGTYAYCFGSITLDGSPANSNRLFNPGQYQLLGGAIATEPDAVSVAMSGVRKNVSSGFHDVSVYIDSAYQGCTLFARTLTIVADIHD
jgi:hypothetical protein